VQGTSMCVCIEIFYVRYRPLPNFNFQNDEIISCKMFLVFTEQPHLPDMFLLSTLISFNYN